MSHDLGEPSRNLAMLGEGNTSARISDDTFIVKASGSQLSTLAPENLVECHFSKLLGLLEGKALADEAVDQALLDARKDQKAKKPSVEAVFHACLLTLPDVNFVGHTHPIAVNRLLCSKWGRIFAKRRLFPDEIVCCGVESVYVPYVDPGVTLAKYIKKEVLAYVKRVGRQPRVILLENHGLIAVGKTPSAVMAATLMATKAAEIFLGAATSGEPVFLSKTQVERIAGRPDEHYRQKMLNL